MSRKKTKRKPKDLEHYRKSVPSSIKARIGKGSYKHIQNNFTTETWNKWFNDNTQSIKDIIAQGEVPSIERIDPTNHYQPSNCIWLPLKVNSVLGKINSLKKELIGYQTYISKNISLFPEELRDTYKARYLD